MLSTQSLREQVDRYAAGAISAEALEEWLAAESWDMRRWVPVGVQRIVEAIQAMFIQYSDGQIAADELKNYLLQRRDQLHRSATTTKELEERRAVGLVKLLRRLEDEQRGAPVLPVRVAGLHGAHLFEKNFLGASGTRQFFAHDSSILVQSAGLTETIITS